MPPDPATFYRLLLVLAVNHDAPSYPEELLSPFSRQLLVECAVRWRISSHLRELTFADAMLSRFLTPDVGREIRFTVLCDTIKRTLDKLIRERSQSTSEDLYGLLHFLNRAEDFFRSHFLAHFSDSLSPSASSADDVIDSFEILERIYADPIFSGSTADDGAAVERGSVRDRLVDLLLEAINERYKSMESEVAEGSLRDISRVAKLAKAIRMEVNAYVWRYPDPLLGSVSVSAFATASYLRHFVLEMENLRHSEQMADGNYTIAEMLELYQIVRILKDVGSAAADDPQAVHLIAGFDVEIWFEPFVSKWLHITDLKVDDWVGGSVAVDKLRPILPPATMHSSSIVDMFAIFHQAFDFIQQLRWPNEITKGSFLCSFSKVMSKALEKYVAFMLEPFRKLDADNRSTGAPTELNAELCVRLNNLLEAYTRFEALVDSMEISHYSHLFTPTLGAKRQRQATPSSIEYHVQVLRARDLVCHRNRPEDYYVQLLESRPSKREVGRTHVVQNCSSGNPTWNEAFRVAAPARNHGTVELELKLMDKEKLSVNRLHGDTKLVLSSTDVPDPSLYSADSILVPNLDDFLPQEIAIPMDAEAARLWVRVQRIGAEDDPRTNSDMRFWTVRTALLLEEAVTDAVRIVSECVVRHVSPAIVTSLAKAGTSPSGDLEHALGQSLAYLDRSCGIVNMFCSDAVGRWLESRHGLGVDAPGAEGPGTDEDPNWLALSIWSELLSSLRKAIPSLDAAASALNPGEVVQWAKNVGKSVGDMFGKGRRDVAAADSRQRRRREGFLHAVELAKALMYCEVDDVRYGFCAAELELEDYKQIRSLAIAA
ncbi:hypothetical protein DFJ74DRAFT_219867 [Hyaloraphidium curvatum]|nr:hypothetical protein DFJ74DRAFT_219867 [Hyaloraphidium curvatum]